MKEKFHLVLDALFSTHKKTLVLFATLVLIISIPITLILVQQRQEIRQRAAEPITCPAPAGGDCGYIPGGHITHNPDGSTTYDCFGGTCIRPPGENEGGGSQYSFCGDGICSSGETQASCPLDCQGPAPTAPPSNCTSPGYTGCQTFNNSVALCQDDNTKCAFGQVCSNGTCITSKVTPTPGSICGDGVCTPQEQVSESCPQDCKAITSPPSGPVCGDGICARGETSATCPQDCKGEFTPTPAPGDVCGDGVCSRSESINETCPQDCGGGKGGVTPPSGDRCGDGVCSSLEQASGSCPQDCGGVSPTPPSFGMAITLFAELPGIGTQVGDNKNPKQPERGTQIAIYDASNQQVKDMTGKLKFDLQKNTYTGTLALGALPSGSYTIKLRMDNTLFKTVPGIQNLVSGRVTVASNVATLVSGDLDQNNILDLFDYNIFLSCFGDKQCAQKSRADLNDDGKVEEVDLNILQRSFALRRGDEIGGGGASPTPTPAGATPTTGGTR